MNNILLLAIAISLMIGVVSIVYGQTVNNESANDFTLEAKVNPSSRLDITRFEIQGESYKQICPSGQCTMNLEHTYLFTPPNADFMLISYTVDFKVQDNQTNPNLGAKKKEFLEQFSASNGICKVDDIIEDNGQELYYCHDTSAYIRRIFDLTSWYYDTIGVYNAKNNTLKISGNFTGKTVIK